MPREAQSPRDILAETMEQGRKVLTPYLAQMLKRKAIVEVDSAEERRMFWLRSATPEQEAQLWQQAMTERGLTPETMTPEQALDIGLGISKQVYQARWDMMSAEGRTSQSDIAMWAARHAAHPPDDQGFGEVTTDGASVLAAGQSVRQGEADQGEDRAVVPQGIRKPAGPQGPEAGYEAGYEAG